MLREVPSRDDGRVSLLGFYGGMELPAMSSRLFHTTLELVRVSPTLCPLLLQLALPALSRSAPLRLHGGGVIRPPIQRMDEYILTL